MMNHPAMPMTAAWVDRWHADNAAADETRKAAKTTNQISAYLTDLGIAQTPSSIAAALSIPRERAKKAI